MRTLNSNTLKAIAFTILKGRFLLIWRDLCNPQVYEGCKVMNAGVLDVKTQSGAKAMLEKIADK